MDWLPPWFHNFCALSADRFSILTETLAFYGLSYEVLKQGEFRHLQVRSGRPMEPQSGEKILVAHYDRVVGSPGANDNGASVWHLVEYLRRSRRRSVPLRVLFSDGEERLPHQGLTDQGIYPLAQSWAGIPELFPVVLDMTGIGDTFVLGHWGEHLWRRQALAPTPTRRDAFAQRRLQARRLLSTARLGHFVEINTPFSDDLAFLMAGIPAVQISLLPRKEALAYQRRTDQDALPSELPPAWRTMHTPADLAKDLWPSTRAVIQDLLENLERRPLLGN